jgi:mercuric ion transport protein
MIDPNTNVTHRSGQAGKAADRGLLALGGFGAALASVCCILPFVLIVLGLGGAWLANLHALYPFRWLFIGAAAVALFFAWHRLYSPYLLGAILN